MSDAKLLSPEVAKDIDTEMQKLMDRYLPGRRPLSLDDYDWGEVQPDAMDRDFQQSLLFVTLVESNIREPGKKLQAAAERGRAPWLSRFVEEALLPEELMHAPPYREYLIRSRAYDAADIDSQIDDVRARGFIYGEGYTPLEAVTYGWLQEMLTWRYYEAMGFYAAQVQREGAPADPVLVKVLRDIAKQENFHRFLYFSGIKAVLKHAPHAKGEVIRVASEFLMPGHHMTPHLQRHAAGWGRKFGFPLKMVLHDISSSLVELVGYNGLGRATILYGTHHKVPWHVKAVASALAPLGRPRSSPVNYLAGRFVSRLS